MANPNVDSWGRSKSSGGGSKNGSAGSNAAEGLGSTLMQSAQNEFNKGPVNYDVPLYAGMSDTTRSGLNSTVAAANAGAGGLNSAYDWAKGVVGSGGYNPALQQAQGGIQDYLTQSGMEAPGYQTLRAKAGADTMKDVSGLFTSSGRFGSGSHVTNATNELGNVYAGMDMQQFENGLARQLGGNQALAGIGQTAMGNAAGAASAMPGLYEGTLMPGRTVTAAGQAFDADAQAKLLADYDQYMRRGNAGFDNIAKYTSLLQGSNGMAGTEKETPWWQSAIGGAVGLAGAFL